MRYSLLNTAEKTSVMASLPPYFKLAMALFCLFTTGGCATNTSLHKENKAVINNVKYIEQKPNYCGPASLAMIFNYWGMSIEQDEIAGEIYSPELGGTISIELVLYAIKKGFEAEMYKGAIENLKNKISNGFPLLVSHRQDENKETVHYLVVWGFDDDEKMIYAHSGIKENSAMDYKTFLKRWGLADNLTIFIHPKGVAIQ